MSATPRLFVEIDLAPVFARVQSDTRTYYVLGYYPSNTRQDGKFRKVRVEDAGDTPFLIGEVGRRFQSGVSGMIYGVGAGLYLGEPRSPFQIQLAAALSGLSDEMLKRCETLASGERRADGPDLILSHAGPSEAIGG